MLYNANSVVAIKNNYQQLQFFAVMYIIKTGDRCYKLFTHIMEIVKFDQHLICYIVKKSTENEKIINFNEMKYFPQNVHTLTTGEIGVRSPIKL